MSLSTIPRLVSELREGRMIILMDDAERENEGDLVMAAAAVTPAHINFMARYACGLICVPMSPKWCQHFGLELMTEHNTARFSTQFTVSVEAATGVSTGISAYDRAHTIQTLANPTAKASSLVRPGHVFPIQAHPEGVLGRRGHTEASCTLVEMAGFEPIAVVVEILKEDGHMARLPDLLEFSKTHGIALGTIEALVKEQSNVCY